MRFLAFAALALAILAAWLLPIAVMLPSVAIAALSVSALAAVVAWQWTAAQGTDHLTLWDISGLFAFVGFAACMLSDPDAVAQFLASGDGQSVGRRQ